MQHSYVCNVSGDDDEEPLSVPQLDVRLKDDALTANVRMRHRSGDDASCIFYDRFGRPVLNVRRDGQDFTAAGDVSGRISDGRHPGDPGVPPIADVGMMLGGAGVDDGTDRVGDDMPNGQIRPFTVLMEDHRPDSRDRSNDLGDIKALPSQTDAEDEADEHDTSPANVNWNRTFAKEVAARRRRALA